MPVLWVLRRAVQHLNQRGYLFVWANVLCLLAMLPLVTAPAAWAGLTHLTYLSATQRQVGLEDFWAGVRRHFWRGLTVTVLNILIVGINAVNLWAYAADPSPTAVLLRPIWAATVLVWFTLQLYLWPILHHQQHPNLWQAMRNAGVMLLLHPLFSLGIWAVLLVLWAISTVLPAAWLLLTLSATAVFLTTAVLDRLGVRGYIRDE
jgi:uncharacterized membrane protein YesL